MSGTIALNTLYSIYNTSFIKYLKYSEMIGGIIFEQSLGVDNIFKITLELVRIFGKFEKSANPLIEQYLIEPLQKEIEKVISFETHNDHVPGIELIAKSVKIFEWLKEDDAKKFVRKLQKYVEFYQQKAHNDIAELGRTYYDWLQHWNETYEEFSIFICNFFQSGIAWTGSFTVPLSQVLGDSAILKVEEQTVPGSVQCHLNSQSPTSEKATVSYFQKQDNNWIVQNQKACQKHLVLNVARKEENVCISNCDDCTIIIETFVNSIRLDLCNRVTILFKNALKVHVIDCKVCNLHCFEKISELNMINCENCGIHLSDNSLDTSIDTSNCSKTNVNFPFEDGVYHSFVISDKLTTKLLQNKGIETSIKQ
ncbi:hypothetical protein ABEB36_004507 [Hypothenemus hampei]|uniref:C-CAP/cofactor C-like domain-containing protein n=1 Tax=Hypothenemus hampei TaxID=57062 RepID=A0ABD1F3J7_HYPHA